MTIEWNKVTEKLPEEGKDYLVWTGDYMIVATADYFDIDEDRQLVAGGIMDEKWLRSIIATKGQFKEFGYNHYFDNPNVYWAELPEGPK